MLTRYLLFFVLLFSINKINAQVHRQGVTPINRGTRGGPAKTPDYTLQDLKGKWQEFKRTDYRGNDVGFGDSLLLNFTDSDQVETRTSISNSMSMTGVASIDGDNNLTAAADQYTIKSFGKNEMVLDDNDQYLHQFKKIDKFWYEMLGKLTIKQDRYDSSVQVQLRIILGKWSVYKKQAKPGYVTGDMQLIKYLNLTTKISDSTASGDITYYQGQSSFQLPCTVTLSGSDIKIVCSQGKWNLSIFQADSNNFIFGDDSLLYFSKKDL
jgi:hypothetical protein